MNLEKRLEQLEQRMSTTDDFMLLIVGFVGCDPDKIGPERAIHHEVGGYSALGRDRRWRLDHGESVEDMTARVEKELRAEGHGVDAVCENYTDEYLAA
jgi:hypothetical protein